MSFEVTDDLIAYVSRLARLSLTEAERRELATHFRKVIDFVEELQRLDLEDVDPSIFSLGASNVDREDEVLPSLSSEDALRNAPEKQQTFFVVPRILGGGADERGSP